MSFTTCDKTFGNKIFQGEYRYLSMEQMIQFRSRTEIYKKLNPFVFGNLGSRKNKNYILRYFIEHIYIKCQTQLSYQVRSQQGPVHLLREIMHTL